MPSPLDLLSIITGNLIPAINSVRERVPTVGGGNPAPIPAGTLSPEATSSSGVTTQPAQSPQSPQSNPYDESMRQLDEIQSSGWNRFLMGPAGQADLATKKAAIQGQKDLGQQRAAASSREYVATTLEALDKISQMDDETKKAVIPVLGPYLKKMNQQAGVEAPDSVLDALASVPGAAQAMRAAFDDPAISQEEWAAHMQAAKGLKRPEIIKYFQDMQAKKMTDLQSQLAQQVIPFAAQIRNQRGLKPTDLLEVSDVASAAAQLPAYEQSRLVRGAVDNILSGKHGEDVLTNAGIVPPSVARKRMENAVAGANPQKPFMTQGLENFLVQSPTFQKQNITPEQLMTLAPEIRNKIQDETIAIKSNYDREQKRAEVMAGAEATKFVNWNSPLAQTAPGQVFRDKQSGELINTYSNTRASLEKMGGQSAVQEFDANGEKAYQSIQEGKVLLGKWVDLANQLADKPGQQFQKGVEEYAKNVIGVPNLKTGMESLQGSILRFAGSIQGSRVQLSDQDRKSVENLFPGMWSTKAVAKQRLGVLRDILQAMDDVQMNRIKPAELSDKINGAMKGTRPKRVGDVNG